ncbi:MAG: substrate-binding domain-containing protein [Nocardioidaceae bacterium]
MTFTTNRRLRPAGAALTLVGALFLAACSSTNSTGASDTSSSDAASAPDIAAGSVGTVDQFGDMAAVCGDKPMKVGVVDGYGTNSWSKTVLAEIESEAAKCPAIESVEFAAGAGDLTTTTSAITSMAAKGVDIILVIPDAGPGKAHVPAMRQATQAGSIVVPFASDPEGTAGTDYLDYVDQDPKYSGKTWAQWVADQLGDKGGNVVFLGGPAGAAVSVQEFEGVKEVLAENPQLNLLTPEPVVTNWDPAQAQEAMAGLLAKNDKIDAVIADYGAVAAGVIRAYESAGISVPLLTSTDDNSLSCGFDGIKAKNSAYELATVTSRTWIGRVALRKAVAQFQGKDDAEPSIYEFALAEDSSGSTAGSVAPADACLADAPSDASPSSLLTSAEFAEIFS